jgi:DNA-binding MarR family transcriptional regulator
MSSNEQSASWTFLTNHTQVLLRLAQDPHVRLRDVAESVGITERAAQRIVAELVAAGYVERTRVGRRNEYAINRQQAMRHVAQFGHEIGGLLDLLSPTGLEADLR